MKDRKLAVRYARALIAAFRDPRQAEAVDRFLSELGAAIDRSAELKAFLADPSVSASRRVGALRSMVREAGLPTELGNFLATLADHNRAASLPSIAQVYHEKREEAMGVVPAEVTTAGLLSEELKARAQAAVEGLTGRSVRLTCKVDPSLLGGVVTQIGSTVYDGSLRTQLSTLRRRMVQE